MSHSSELKQLVDDPTTSLELREMLKAARQDAPPATEMLSLLASLKTIEPNAAPVLETASSKSQSALLWSVPLVVLSAVVAYWFLAVSPTASTLDTKSHSTMAQHAEPSLETKVEAVVDAVVDAKTNTQIGSRDLTEAITGTQSEPTIPSRRIQPKAPVSLSEGKGEPVLVPTEGLAKELHLIGEARRALKKKQWKLSLAATRTHQRLFSHGEFIEERESLAIEATYFLGKKTAATKRLLRFRASYPKSGYIGRLNELLDEQSP